MNELKFLEVMGKIDDDLIKEAEITSDTLSETESSVNVRAELSASGVEIYRRSGWLRFAAVASSVLLIIGLSAFGGYRLMNRKSANPDHNNNDPVTVATTAENSDNTSTENAKGSTVTTGKGQKTTVTTAAEDNTAGQYAVTSVTAKNGDKTKYTGTSAAAERRTASGGTTAKRGSAVTTARTTTTAPKTTGSVVKPPVNGRMTEDIVLQLAQNGDALTWKDFEPYEHTDIGSGQDVWKILVYKDSKSGNDYDFTLIVSGVPEKKPKITLVRGAYTGSSSQDRVDLRSGDVYNFMHPEIALSTVLGTLKECHPAFIRSIELSYPWYTYPAKLSYPELEEILRMIQELTFTKNEGSKWQSLSTNMLRITVTDNNGMVHELGTQYPYFLADGTAYSVSEEKLTALTERCVGIIKEHQPSGPIDISGVWCWHSFEDNIGSIRDISESIRLSQFPDFVFMWNGKEYYIEAYNSAGRKFATIPVQFNAYFADINGDGYPELCTTYDLGLNRDIFIEVRVWDIHNELAYTLSGGEEDNYILYEENGELFVNKEWKNSAWSILSKHGEKGRLGFENGQLVFIPV